MSKQIEKHSAKKAPVKRAIASKHEASDEDVETEIRRFEQMERLLQLSGGGAKETKETAERKPARFQITPEQAKQITCCETGNGYAALRILVEGAFESLEVGQADKQDVLESIRSYLLSVGPASPLEALPVGQALVSHTLACRFASKALHASDPITAGRFAERSARFMEVFGKQLEMRQRIRGEVVQQRVVVQHQHNSISGPGAQTVIASVQSGGVLPPQNEERNAKKAWADRAQNGERQSSIEPQRGQARTLFEGYEGAV